MVDAGGRYCLAIDLGTGGPKVGFVSLTGEIAWCDHVAVQTHWVGDGGAEQDAEEWWTVICEAAKRGLASGAVDPASVAAVSVTGQWASTVPVDADGVPVGPCVMWMDTRGGKHSYPRFSGPLAGYSTRVIMKWVRRTGGAPSRTGADPIGHRLYLQHDRPEIHAKARWYLEPVDYLSMRFCGVAHASHASMTASWLTNNRDLSAMHYDDELVAMAGVDATKLPPLRPTGSVVGTVKPEVAEQLGLPANVQVVTGTPDLHSATCGAGAVNDFEAHLAISTTSWLSCPVPFKKTDVFHQIASVPGISTDRYVVANNHDTSGLCLQWVRDNVLGEPQMPYADVLALAGKVAPGSGNVIFTPWLTGERTPIDDRWARGGFQNVSLDVGRAELVRAVLEGVAYNDRWLLDYMEKFTKRRLGPIRIIGGGAQGDLWCQIHADVMGRTIERVADPNYANLKGAAIFAGLGLGAIQKDDVRDLVKVDGTFRPDSQTRVIYDRLYAEFPGLYDAQKKMFKRVNRPQKPR